MLVNVTEYVRPNGRRTHHQIGIDDKYQRDYDSMNDAGCCLEAEVLRTGQISLTVTSEDADVDILIFDEHKRLVEKIGEILSRRKWDVVQSDM